MVNLTFQKFKVLFSMKNTIFNYVN